MENSKVPDASVQFPTDDEADDCPAAEAEDNSDNDNAGDTKDNVKEEPCLQNGTGATGEKPAIKKVSWETDDSSDDDDEEDEKTSGVADKWKTEDGANTKCACIICPHETVGYEAADAMKIHIESTHDLSFSRLKTTFHLDYPGFVQFVKWARELKEKGTSEESIKKIWSLSSPSEAPWLSDKYLLPQQKERQEYEQSQEFLPNSNDDIDYFLTLDYFAEDNHVEGEEVSSSVQSPSIEEVVAQLNQLKIEKQRMVEVFQRIFTEGKSSSTSRMGQHCTRVLRGRTEDHISRECVPITSRRRPPKVRKPHPYVTQDEIDEIAREQYVAEEQDRLLTVRLNEVHSRGSIGSHNELYFNSYNDVDIHHEMVFDIVRTEAYRSAIFEQQHKIKGKKVMDLGCGTGILSMFCAQHNPRVVFAVDNSEIIFDAMSNGFENNFDNLIQYIHKDIDNENMLSEIGKIDVLVSEFMGYFLFFEGMTETFIRVRDRYLKPDGIILPDACKMELVPLGDSGIYKSRVACWENAFGFRMPAIQTRVLHETLVETVSPSEIIGDPVQIKALNLRTCNINCIHVDTEFEFEFNQDAQFCAIAGYFSVEFSGGNNPIILSTSPYDTPTHWKQSVFFLPKRYNVKAGERIAGKITTRPSPENARWLTVYIKIGENTQRYEFR